MHIVCLKIYVHDICFCMHFVVYLYLSLLFVAVCRRYHVLFTLFAFLPIVVSNTYCVVFLFPFPFLFFWVKHWYIKKIIKSKCSQHTKCICTKMYIDITCVFPVSPSFSFFTICSYLLSSFCVPYVVSYSRLSIFALHFGILLRIFWNCGRCILILLDKCMLWWLHVRINT